MGPKIEAGQFIKFFYNPPVKPAKPQWKQQQVTVKNPDGSLKTTTQNVRAAAPPPPPSDKNKEVFVLHPNWKGRIHGLDMKRLTPAQQQIVHAMMDPEVKAKVDAGQWPVDGVPNYNLLRDILRRSDPATLINSPIAFYQQLIKPFIAQADCYRQYDAAFMSNTQVITESEAQGQMTNPKPLFKKL